MAVTVAEMLKMSQSQLDDLFTQSPTGEIPSGEAKGTAIIAPGTTYTQDMANFVNHFAWQGKNFDTAKGILLSRRRWMESDCARPIFITARCRRCATC